MLPSDCEGSIFFISLRISVKYQFKIFYIILNIFYKISVVYFNEICGDKYLVFCELQQSI